MLVDVIGHLPCDSKAVNPLQGSGGRSERGERCKRKKSTSVMDPRSDKLQNVFVQLYYNV